MVDIMNNFDYKSSIAQHMEANMHNKDYPEILLARELFDERRIDVILKDNDKGLILVIDDKIALFFYKNEEDELYYDGWEKRVFSDHYWKEFKGRRI